MSVLDHAWVERELREQSGIGLPLRCAALTTSTNDDAKRAAKAGAPAGACFVAEAQSHGRGRRGRSWLSSAGEGLLFSVILRPPALLDPSPLTLAIGLGLHQAIQPYVAARLSLKWPNDLVCGRQKLGGILVESELQGTSVAPVIVGIGLNVSTAAFPDELSRSATSLALLGASVGRERILVDALGGIGTWYERFVREGVGPVVEALRERDALHGQRIAVDGVPGEGAGFDEQGRLLLRTVEGVRPVLAGTIEWAE